MNLKRTKVSCVLWFFFVLTTCLIGYSSVRKFCLDREMQEKNIWFLCAGVLLCGGLFSVLAIFVRRKIRMEVRSKKIYWFLAEFLIVTGILAAGVIMRINALPQGTPEDLYFRNAGGWLGLAEVKFRQPVSNVGGYEGAYLNLLHGIFFLLGNTTYFSCRFQLVLTILAGILLYFGVRGIAGKIPSITFLAFYCLTPCFVEKTDVILAEPLILAAYGASLFLIGIFMKRAGTGRIFAFIIGALAGVMGYHEIFGFTLISFALFAKNVNADAGEVQENAKLINAGFISLGCLAGFFAAVICRSISFHVSIPVVLSNYWRNHFSLFLKHAGKNFEIFLTNANYEFYGTNASILLFFFLILFGVTFFAIKDVEKSSPWICCVLATGFGMLNDVVSNFDVSGFESAMGSQSGLLNASFDGNAWLLICLFTLAGIGIDAIACRPAMPKMAILNEESETEKGGSAEEVEAAKIKSEENKEKENAGSEEGAEAEKVKSAEDTEAEKVKSAEDIEAEKVKSAENIEAEKVKSAEDTEAEKVKSAEDADAEKVDSRDEPETEKPKNGESTPDKEPDTETIKERKAGKKKPVKKAEGASKLDYDYEVSDDDDYDLNE